MVERGGRGGEIFRNKGGRDRIRDRERERKIEIEIERESGEWETTRGHRNLRFLSLE